MFAHPRAPGATRRALSLLVIAALAAAPQAGCHDDHAHPHPHEGDAPAAAAPEPIVESHTVYTDQIEHFDEHPPLIAGKPTKFAAHATDVRADFKSIREGTMTVVALREGKVVAESPPAKNSRPGIFGPIISIPSAGKVEIRMRLETPSIKDEASLGEVMVYASDADAAKAHEGGEEEGGEKPIAFLKEQQWKIEFRNEAAAKRRLVETLRVPGQVVARPGSRAVVAAPASGLTLPPEGGFPRLGDRIEAGALTGSIAPVLGGVEGTQLMATRAELEVKAIGVETEVARARAKHARAGRLLERAERLRKSGAVSERELEDARFEAELSASEVTATAKLLEPYDAVRRARGGGSGGLLAVPLRAPVSGMVAMAKATPGEFVEAGRALFEIVDLASVWIEGEVPEPDLLRLPPKPPATYVFAAPGATPTAEGLSFVALAPVVDPEMRSTRIVYACENAAGALRLGAAVDLVLETAHAEEALAFPESAIVDEDGRPIVYVQTEGEAFERREVTLGLRSQGYVQVLAGVEPGERVVTKGAYAVRLQSVSTTIPAHGHAH